jgi:hypothetical protein
MVLNSQRAMVRVGFDPCAGGLTRQNVKPR